MLITVNEFERSALFCESYVNSSEYIRLDVSLWFSSYYHKLLKTIMGVAQVQIGTHSFTFDHVYGNGGSPSSAMFDECAAPLVEGLFQGYNATVLAYGQVLISTLYKSALCLKKLSLSTDMCNCCRQDLAKHTPWVPALKKVLRQD